MILSGFNEKPSCKKSLGTKGKKAGPKSLWTTEMLNNLVDIIANDDNLKRKLIFTNTRATSNAEAYKTVVKEMEKRCDARGETFELDVTQTHNKFKKLMSTCKSALVTIKTASGIFSTVKGKLLSRQTESVRDHKFHSGYGHSSMDRGHFISHLHQTQE